MVSGVSINGDTPLFGCVIMGKYQPKLDGFGVPLKYYVFLYKGLEMGSLIVVNSGFQWLIMVNHGE